MTQPIFACDQVTITYPNATTAVRDLSLSIAPGECLALVGQSGCGKTTLAKAALGLLPAGTQITGSIRLGDAEIIGAAEQSLRLLRGRVVGLVAQDPFAACNPLARVFAHVAEAWRAHGLRVADGKIVGALADLGIDDAGTRAQQYPHQWSGGMLQRAVIAAATAHQPTLIIADEPTSALDADRAQATLTRLRQAAAERRAAVLLITHDLQLAANYAERIAVCQAGRIIEMGATATILNEPRHPYTVALLGARPRPGSLVPRSFAADDAALIAEACEVSKVYAHGKQPVRAVVNATLRVRSGEIVGIHGPSGCGKSTLLRLLATLEEPTTGIIKLGGAATMRPRRDGFVMPIFQDPVSSLDRRWPVWRTLTEPLTARHRRQHSRWATPTARNARREAATTGLAAVGLAEIDLGARPDELSIGQCQRVAIARALAAEPALLVADEPTSALDTASAATVLRLLAAAAHKGTAVVIVSHDRLLLSVLAHRVLEMRDGVLAG